MRQVTETILSVGIHSFHRESYATYSQDISWNSASLGPGHRHEIPKKFTD